MNKKFRYFLLDVNSCLYGCKESDFFCIFTGQIDAYEKE